MAARKAKLIGIEEAAHLFGKSIHQMRQYKSKGLLKVAETGPKRGPKRTSGPRKVTRHRTSSEHKI